jgi:type I site-specific restriction endonuclease
MPDLNEAKTRAALINPQLEKAGWNLCDRSQVQFEVPVKGYDPAVSPARVGHDYEQQAANG